MSTWRIFKKIITKKKDAIFAKEREAIDKDLPLGFRLGAMVTLDQSDFIINRDKLKFESPGTEHIVKAWSEFEIFDTKFYRFYLLGKENESESIIEVAVVDGKPEEVKLLLNEVELMPADENEWEAWLGSDGMIGDHIFESIDNEDTPEEVVTTYWTQWGEENQRITPIQFTEKIFLDRYGDNVEDVVTTGALYARPVDEEEKTLEYMMVGQEELDNDAYVRILIGMNIGEGDIKVV